MSSLNDLISAQDNIANIERAADNLLNSSVELQKVDSHAEISEIIHHFFCCRSQILQMKRKMLDKETFIAK